MIFRSDAVSVGSTIRKIAVFLRLTRTYIDGSELLSAIVPGQRGEL